MFSCLPFPFAFKKYVFRLTSVNNKLLRRRFIITPPKCKKTSSFEDALRGTTPIANFLATLLLMRVKQLPYCHTATSPKLVSLPSSISFHQPLTLYNFPITTTLHHWSYLKFNSFLWKVNHFRTFFYIFIVNFRFVFIFIKKALPWVLRIQHLRYVCYVLFRSLLHNELK